MKQEWTEQEWTALVDGIIDRSEEIEELTDGRPDQANSIVTPLTFEQRITEADAIHARGMSISLR